MRLLFLISTGILKVLGFFVCFTEKVKYPEIYITSGSAVLFEGELLELLCSVKRGNYVSYKWLVNGGPVSPSSLRQDQVYKHRLVKSLHFTCVYMCPCLQHFRVNPTKTEQNYVHLT